jgi:hypothetical protein
MHLRHGRTLHLGRRHHWYSSPLHRYSGIIILNQRATCTGALGHGTVSNEPFPRLVEAFQNKTVKSVVCGARHTVCVVLAGINQNQSLLMTDVSRICEAEELRGGHTLGTQLALFLFLEC